jgi:ribosomal protein S18 acetylase RimI-like enzyme
MVEPTQQLTDLQRLDERHAQPVSQFLGRLPDGDLTFLKEAIDDATVGRWIVDTHARRWVATGQAGEVQALLTLVPGTLWSAHVGELRLVVGESYRGRGLGRRLARYGLADAVRLGLQKIVVEVVADKEADIAMFESIGFEPEALLRDQIRDRQGVLHDLVLLSHEVDAGASALDVLGIGSEVGLQELG